MYESGSRSVGVLDASPPPMRFGVSAGNANEGRFTSDFSMDLALENDNQLQSQYFTPNTVTLYIAVVHYKQRGRHYKVYYIVVSDDKAHDEHAVRTFQNAITADLRRRGVQITRWVWWSDGAGQHFKSVPAWREVRNHDLLNPEKGGVPVIRCHTASDHGKGEHDGAATYVKQQVKNYLKSEEGRNGENGIRNAEQCYCWCRANLTGSVSEDHPWKSRQNAVSLDERRFIHVPAEEIVRPGKEEVRWKSMDVQTYHELFFDPREQAITGRDLACACERCRKYEYHMCLWGQWVEPPRELTFTYAYNQSEEAKLRIACACRATRNTQNPKNCEHCLNRNAQKGKGARASTTRAT